jgi:hypothetical protein
MQNKERTYKRATTDEQKREIIERLYQMWIENPQLRLGQLIGNVFHYPSGIDPYHWEDYDFIAALEDAYKEGENAEKT